LARSPAVSASYDVFVHQLVGLIHTAFTRNLTIARLCFSSDWFAFQVSQSGLSPHQVINMPGIPSSGRECPQAAIPCALTLGEKFER
jgi:hypothetical protein